MFINKKVMQMSDVRSDRSAQVHELLNNNSLFVALMI